MTGSIAGTRSLKVLEAAARHLNFTRAAAELGLTPGAVSHQIKELETQLPNGSFPACTGSRSSSRRLMCESI